MKLNHLRPILLGLFLVGTSQARPAQADVITSFSFNNAAFQTSDGGQITTITNNFNDGVDHTAQGVTSDPRDEALQLYNTDPTGTINNQGKWIQFGVNTTSTTLTNVTMSTMNLNSGFTTGTFQYSSNGGSTFTTLRTYSTGTTYATETFSLSGISALNNNTQTTFRILFSGGSTTSTSAANAIDNLTVNGTIGTPEPSTYAMMLIGLLTIGCLAANKRKTSFQKEKVV